MAFLLLSLSRGRDRQRYRQPATRRELGQVHPFPHGVDAVLPGPECHGRDPPPHQPVSVQTAIRDPQR